MNKSKVYFSKIITSERIVDLYKHLNVDLQKRVCIKVHTGEKGNINYLHPEFMKPIVEYVGGRVVETNTAYNSYRNETSKHKKIIYEHGWNMFDFDLLDAEGPDVILNMNGRVLKKDIVGKNLLNYDSMLVLSHFKGHNIGGYGGALKQLSIGMASRAGKAYIHSGGKTTNKDECWNDYVTKDDFMACMADAALAITDYFKGNIAYINIMKNISKDCDCDYEAPPPCMKDIGILASSDPVAIDKACLDIIENSDDKGKYELLERINSLHGGLTPIYASELGIGNLEYELIDID